MSSVGFNTPAQFVLPEGGTLLLDKPLEWTSFDVVKKVRGMFRVKKVGHAGTLDPLATGLLILCSGKQTKSIDHYQGQHKVYEGTMRFGATTPSYDSATEADAEYPYEHLSAESISEAAKRFEGRIEQIPPMYSALKKEGKRLYDLARKGIEVERNARPVEIFQFSITRYEAPEATFTVECSKGTYVRSLVHDIAKALGSGAYLTSLRRTMSGDYSVRDAWSLEGLQIEADSIRQEKATA